MNDDALNEVNELLEGSPYQAEAHLGRGAVATVFVVRHIELSKKFALKLVHAHLMRAALCDGPSVYERIRREARALGRIEHPHIVSVIDFAEARDGRPYLVLELMQGHSLARELHQRGRFPVSEALIRASQALDGLDAAHALGIVHRDIAPSNLFLQNVPDYGSTLKILDFGLARLLRSSPAALQESSGASTKTGSLIGSPGYASPEALLGERVDQRADVYALGMILYEMLSGMGPYDFVDTNYPQPSKYNSAISPQLDLIVMRSLEKDRTARFQSAGAFLSALRPLLTGSRSKDQPRSSKRIR